ncbi:MAG: molybdopterin molybdotransferase MoeA [Proteobacteria bacterium]|nr:molybdopterin molybdotransferase MoeA [Pseudomonadota bacterium]MBU1455341.1 molybdopterin molybdotransferase MoeA [Pseudomonadota bacterium]
MGADREQGVDLKTAQRMILGECAVLPEETVPLGECLDRFSARSLPALEPLPGFDQSLRDGYGIARPEQGAGGKSSRCFRVVSEVAAGDTRKFRLHTGQAVRIMTGGLLPLGCLGVVPQECCRTENGTVEVPDRFLRQTGFFVHARGSNMAKGSVIVSRGTPVRPEHQIDLAGVGYHALPVVEKPRVSFFCTGSELVPHATGKIDGQKFSANPYLLQSLIRLAGAIPQNLGMVADDLDAVCQVFTGIDRAGADVIISTGGMGPGKFDLIEEAFSRVGGKVIYRSLKLRPGTSTIFGLLGTTLFFGMPGPPPAVHLLFNELLHPALLRLQGAGPCTPKQIRARLTEELVLKKRDFPRLKNGRLTIENGACLVRPARRNDPASCYIYCPAGRRVLRSGEMVRVHLVGGHFASSSPVNFG